MRSVRTARTVALLLTDEEGATAIEYALIGSLIALAIMAAAVFFSSQTSIMWNTIASHLT